MRPRERARRQKSKSLSINFLSAITNMHVIKLFFAFRYQISRDLSKYNSAICGHKWFSKEGVFLFETAH